MILSLKKYEKNLLAGSLSFNIDLNSDKFTQSKPKAIFEPIL